MCHFDSKSQQRSKKRCPSSAFSFLHAGLALTSPFDLPFALGFGFGVGFIPAALAEPLAFALAFASAVTATVEPSSGFELWLSVPSAAAPADSDAPVSMRGVSGSAFFLGSVFLGAAAGRFIVTLPRTGKTD